MFKRDGKTAWFSQVIGANSDTRGKKQACSFTQRIGAELRYRLFGTPKCLLPAENPECVGGKAFLFFLALALLLL